MFWARLSPSVPRFPMILILSSKDVRFRSFNGFLSTPGAPIILKKTEEHFFKMRRPGLGARTHENWNNVPYYVPALPPTGPPHCRNIDIKHWLNI
jgi:hypothetical protein